MEDNSSVNTRLEDMDNVDIIELDGSGINLITNKYEEDLTINDLEVINDYLSNIDNTTSLIDTDEVTSRIELSKSDDPEGIEAIDVLESTNDLSDDNIEEEYSDADLEMINDYLNSEELEDSSNLDITENSDSLEIVNNTSEDLASSLEEKEYSREDINMINDYLNQEDLDINSLSSDNNSSEEVLNREDIVSEGTEEEYSDADLEMINDYLNSEELEESANLDITENSDSLETINNTSEDLSNSSEEKEYSREDINMINDYLNQEDLDVNSLSSDNSSSEEVLNREDIVSEGTEEEYSDADLEMINDYLNSEELEESANLEHLENSDSLETVNNTSEDLASSLEEKEYSREDINMINDYLNQEDLDINSLSSDNNSSEEVLNREDIVSEGTEEEYSDADLEMINDYLNSEELEESANLEHLENSDSLETVNNTSEDLESSSEEKEYSREDINMINDYLNQEDLEVNSLSSDNSSEEVLNREDIVSEGIEEPLDSDNNTELEIATIDDDLVEVEEVPVNLEEYPNFMASERESKADEVLDDNINTDESTSTEDTNSTIDDDLVEIEEIPVNLEEYPNFMASEREENIEDNSDSVLDIVNNIEDENRKKIDDINKSIREIKSMESIDTIDVDNIVNDSSIKKEDSTLEIPDEVEADVDEEFTLENNNTVSVLHKNYNIDYNRIISAFSKDEDFNGELKQIDLDYAKQLYEVENVNNVNSTKCCCSDLLSLEAGDISKFRSLFSYFTSIIDKMPDDVKKEFAKTHYYDMYSTLLKKFDF